MSDNNDRGRLSVPADERPGPPPELRTVGGSRSRALGAFLATFALVAFAGVVWYAYDRGLHAGSEIAAPVIKADSRPVKIRPEQPGGMEIPNQDKLVFDALRPEEDQLPRVERLLPPPEAPAPRPEAPVVEAPAAAPAAAADTSETPAEASIPPARVVTPAPAPAIPAPAISAEEPPTPQAPAAPQTPAASAPPAENPAVAAAPPPPAPKAPEPVVVAPKPEPRTEPAAVPVPATAQPAAGAYRIQLAAVRSEEVAASEWARLQRRYSDVLGALSPHYQRIDLGASKGIFYRVQGGDISETSAQDICARLKAQDQACLVVAP
jgi:hypothetical protein